MSGLILPHPKRLWFPWLNMGHLMESPGGGHLARTDSGHLAKCLGECPALDAVDWYLYLCNGLPSAWCPTEDFLGIAINLGTGLSVGTNDFAQSDFSCTGQLFEEFCTATPTYTSCTRDFDFTNVNLRITVASITGGYEFDVALTADVDTTDCDSNAWSNSNETLLTSDTSSPSAPAKCENGVYTGGTYAHRNVSITLLICGTSGLGSGGSGLWLDENDFDIYEADFFVAPLASIGTCP